jgi:tetratricopeptide (TPR) repeat protein/outer membrane protein assembly factor BamB
MTFLRFALLSLMPLAVLGESPRSPQQQQEESVFIDEVKKDFLEKIQKCEEAKDWKGLFEHYAHGIRRYSQKVIPLDKGPNPERYTSVSEFLTQRLARLPKEAYEYYRLENDGRARSLLDRAREEHDRRKVEQVVEEYFFSSVTDEALDFLAHQAFDEGRVEESIFYWNRLLRCYPDSKIPRAVTAARIANACRIVENEAALNDLRQYAEAEKIDGALTVGGQELKLGAYLKTVAVAARVSAPRPLKVPWALGAEDRDRRKVMGVRNDIRRWIYDYAADKGEPVGQAQPEPPNRLAMGRLRRMQMEGQPVPQFGDFPFFPAHTKLRGRDFVVFTDGTRVVAIDPAKVKGTSTTTGIYWKFPTEGQILRPNPNGNGNGMFTNRPYAGVAIDGDYAFATMVSRLEIRPRDNNPNNFDLFEGTTSVKCFHIPSGKLVWDTDAAPLMDDMKVVCKDFFDRNFSFSAQPLIRGERLYLGICTSPVGEQESRVLCLDRKTGKPLWCTFVASVSGGRGNPWNFGNGRGVVYQTLLAEQGGALFALTNLGCVASLNSVTGNVLWLTKYRRSAARGANAGAEMGFLRPANWPIVWKGQVFALPQDRSDLAAFDKISGKEIQIPNPKTREGELDWKNMTHLVGIVDDWMVVGGTVSHVVRLRDFQAYSLASSNTARCGRGMIDGDLVYLPAASNQGGNQVGVLAIYDVRTWKSLDQPSWKEPNEYGNLLIAGNYLVVATQKLTVYTDVETLRNEFAARLYQSPPHAASLFEYGETMRENDRLEEAAEAYLGYIRAAEGDPALRPRVLEVKKELHGIFVKRGDEAGERGDQAKALEFYQFAKGFAYDGRTEADSTKRMAQAFEKLQRWKDAIGMYQELIAKGRSLYERQSDEVFKMTELARRNIDAILAKTPDAYEEVEKQAAEALRKAKEGGVEALKEVMDRFPNSKTAREAWGRMRDTLLKEGKFEKLRSLYAELKDRFKIDLNLDSYQELLEILRKLRDHERMRYELPRMADRFGPESITTEAGEETVKDWAERMLRELPPPGLSVAKPLKRLAELDPLKPTNDPLGLPGGCQPLRPLGIVPPELGRDLEFFARGSCIELWDLKEKRLVWRRAHPGAYLGVVFADPSVPDLAGVVVMAVRPGSPAETAGVKRDDLLVTLDGRPVTASSLDDLLAERAPGAAVEIALRRPTDPQKKAWEDRKVQVGLSAHPADHRPAIVGASFTRAYELAVAWEDGVSCLDLATGRVEWTFRDIRERFHVRAFHATEGRLYLYEAHRPERDRDVFRGYSDQARNERAIFRAEDAHHRLLCLNDLTGDLAWARAFDFDPNNANQDTQVFFFDKYLSDQVHLLQGISRPGSRDWVLWAIPSADGRTENPRKNLMGQVLAHAADLERGILYYVADVNNDRKDRSLYSVSMDPSRKDFKAIELPLNTKFMPPTHFACSLAANGDRVCLLVSPPQAGGEPQLWSLNLEGKDERKIALPEGRTLPLGRPTGTLLDTNGLLYLYNIPREKAAPSRAFLTALRIAAKEPAEMVVWDAVAPVVANTPTGTWQVISEPNGCAVFTAARAAIPGQSGETPVAVVYDQADGGYIRAVHADLLVAADGWGVAGPPASWWRGRLYVSAKQGLQIFGD